MEKELKNLQTFEQHTKPLLVKPVVSSRTHKCCGCGKPALHYYEPFNEWFCDKCDKFKITIIGEIVDHALYGY